MRALSIRQPYAELILRGINPIEFRSRPTKIIGERFYVYMPSGSWAVWTLFR
jgi:predicted transcriptional regulator